MEVNKIGAARRSGGACLYPQVTRHQGGRRRKSPSARKSRPIPMADSVGLAVPEGTRSYPRATRHPQVQGFPVDCTAGEFPHLGRRSPLGARWKMAGNAIPVPLAEWVGGRLRAPGQVAESVMMSPWTARVWPDAACNLDGKIEAVTISEWPLRRKWVGLERFLKHPTSELSERACAGFLVRARSGKLRFAPGFLEAVALQARASESPRSRVQHAKPLTR
jgi:DNA (cytosine-5)-methyltransferase 1